MKKTINTMVTVIALVLIALVITSCNGTIKTPFGEIIYEKNPPDKEKPEIGDPWVPVTFDGKEYQGYDVDSDGLIDWIFDPERGVWFYLQFRGKDPTGGNPGIDGDAVIVSRMIFGFEDFDDPRPPDLDLGAEYYLDRYDLWQEFEIGVEFTVIGGPVVYDLDAHGAGTLDVTLNWSGDWYTLPPAWYAATANGVGRLEWEIYEVEPLNPANPSYVRTRIRGDSAVVAGYLLDMGLINVLDDQGNVVLQGDPTTRAVYFNGVYVFDAIPEPTHFPSKF